MKFYSGFSLCNDAHFFEVFIKNSEYTVCGFSYGAIKALRDVQERIKQGKRVDTLQLFSPAFFQSQSDKFKRLQTLAYTKSQSKYLAQFINGCFSPYASKKIEHSSTDLEELEDLLNYIWNIDDLKYIEEKGVVIEVYLGGKDNIIDVKSAEALFLEVATVTYIKNANHFLQIN